MIADDVQLWLEEQRKVPQPVAAAVASALLREGYSYLLALLDVPRGDLVSLSISKSKANVLHKTLKQQQDMVSKLSCCSRIVVIKVLFKFGKLIRHVQSLCNAVCLLLT